MLEVAVEVPAEVGDLIKVVQWTDNQNTSMQIPTAALSLYIFFLMSFQIFNSLIGAYHTSTYL